MKRVWIFSLISLAAALLLAGLVSPFASRQPDGLERVAEEKNFSFLAETEPVYKSNPFPEYQVPGVRNEFLSTSLSGILGVLAVFALATSFALAIRAFRRTEVRRDSGEPEHDRPPSR